MAYFKLEFGFGRSKSEGKISDSANQADEQAVLEIPGWDFVKGEVERAKQEGRFKVAGNYLTAARSFTKFILLNIFLAQQKCRRHKLPLPHKAT